MRPLLKFLGEVLLVYGTIGVAMLVCSFAGQPRTYVIGDEHFETNVVSFSGDNHSGCEVCWSIRQGKIHVPYPISHPLSHVREPFIPATERWTVTNLVENAVLRVQWRGSEYWLTNQVRILKSDTNLFRTQWAPVPLPPSPLP